MSSGVDGADISSETTQHTYEYDEDTEIGVAVVEAVARVAGVDPTEIETRVNDIVDPDALDRCVRSGRSDLSVAFRFDDYRVVVSGGGTLAVAETGEE